MMLFRKIVSCFAKNVIVDFIVPLGELGESQAGYTGTSDGPGFDKNAAFKLVTVRLYIFVLNKEYPISLDLGLFMSQCPDEVKT